MFHNSLLAKSVRFALIGGATAAALSTTAVYAADDGAKKVERIEVTGSRIKRVDMEGTSPIVTIGEEAIQITGASNVANFINELPSVGIPGSSATNSNFSTTATGLNTVDLRGLGTDRTLILVNGRRHIPGLAGSSAVDVSMIPVELVKRVDVVTGGASAVYGSEAIAGVINFIMKDDFEGLEFNSRVGTTEAGGADDKDFSLTVGGNFDGRKGNAIAHVAYSNAGELRSSDRNMSAHDATNSSYGPKGNFFIPGKGFITLDESTGKWDKPFKASEDGFDRNAERMIRVPTERLQFNANTNYSINEHFNFFNETAYSELNSSSRLEPTITGESVSVGESLANIRMPLNNGFMPAELRDAVLAADPTATEVSMYRRFTELGPRTSDIERKVFRTAVGFDGAINDSFDYSVYYQYGSNTQSQQNGGVFNALNFYNALQTESDGAGGLQCADDFSRDLGCVPVDVFGSGSITGDALKWVSVDNQLSSNMQQNVFGSSVTGSLFELPAGELGVAFGYEWRKEQSEFNSDALAQSGLTSGNTTPNTRGEYDVSEFYIEFNVPLLADVPLAKYLGLELAARTSDYSTVGSASAYKAALNWSPFDDLKIRGSISTAVRAPNIGELFDPGSETFRSFVDPCALGGKGGQSANPEAKPYTPQSAEVQANCATIAGTATLDPAALNITSAGGLSAGNPDLGKEESETTTVGFVYSPSYVENLGFTVDYYKITIDDAINSFSAQVTVDQCVRQGSFPNNPFCDLIQRDPVTGLVTRIDALAINVAKFEVSGIDFTSDYTMDLGSGNLNLNLTGTYSLSNDFSPFEGGDVVDSQGQIGIPDLKVNFAAIYSLDDLTLSWSTRYISDVNVDNENIESFGRVGSMVYSDLQARYFAFENLELYVGVDNIFDKRPPFLGQGVPGDVTGTNTAADVYDVYGRSYYAGFKAKF